MARKITMQPNANFDASKLARSLLRRSRQGALATLMPESGDPYCSLVHVASHADASPMLLISRLALHTKNILGDGRVSLMLDERAAGDPLEGARIMLAGRGGRGTGRPPGPPPRGRESGGRAGPGRPQGGRQKPSPGPPPTPPQPG